MKKLFLAFILAITICGSGFSQTQYESYWPDFNGGAYAFQAPLVAAIMIDNEIITAEYEGWYALEVAFFVGDECRGSGANFPDSDPAMFYLDNSYVEEYGDPFPILNPSAIYYSDITGELVSIKMYDHERGILYENCEILYLGEPMQILTGEDHEEGWDDPDNPIFLCFTTPGYTLEIDRYTGQKDNYYLIASPVGPINAGAVQGLMTPDYDFYSFNPAPEDGLEWINHRDNGEFILQPGVGYLYANNTGTDLVFRGSGVTEGDYVFTLDYVTNNPDFPDNSWNLLGNPFCKDATIGESKPFYRMIEGALVGQDAGTAIPAMQGFFVNAEQDGEEITIEPAPEQGGKSPSLALNLSNNGKVVDRAIVSFGQGQQLPKFQLFKSSKVYIPMEGKDYAVVNSAKQGEMPVSFKAESNGTYTFSVNTEAMGMKYLHLIDNRTGDDIDLLATPSYSFNARTTDNASRFKLVFMANDETNSDAFAFVSDGKLIVTGEGTLQVFDVLGHQLVTKELSTLHSPLSIFHSPGVYVLQLTNGNDIKTQKIVIE